MSTAYRTRTKGTGRARQVSTFSTPPLDPAGEGLGVAFRLRDCCFVPRLKERAFCSPHPSRVPRDTFPAGEGFEVAFCLRSCCFVPCLDYITFYRRKKRNSKPSPAGKGDRLRWMRRSYPYKETFCCRAGDQWSPLQKPPFDRCVRTRSHEHESLLLRFSTEKRTGIGAAPRKPQKSFAPLFFRKEGGGRGRAP